MCYSSNNTIEAFEITEKVPEIILQYFKNKIIYIIKTTRKFANGWCTTKKSE